MRPTESLQLRIALLNAENLFIFLDHDLPKPLNELNEVEWQKLSRSTHPNKPLKRCLWLAESIVDIAPDILLLCEVGGLESIQNFNRFFLNSEYQEFLIEGNSDRGIDVGVLIKKTLPFKYLFNSHKRRPLDLESNGKPAYFSRDLVELRVFDPQNGSTPLWVIFLTHLKSKWDRSGVDPEGRIRRTAEVNKATQIIQEVMTETQNQVPIIFAGDLNAGARALQREPEFDRLFNETELRDIFDILNRPPSETATQIQFKHGYVRFPVQIDHILISPHLDSMLVPSESYVYRYKTDGGISLPYPEDINQRNSLPSDHFPVVMTLQVPDKNSASK